MPLLNIWSSVQEVLVLFMHTMYNVTKYTPRKYKTFTYLTMSTTLQYSDVVLLVIDRENTSMVIARIQNTNDI